MKKKILIIDDEETIIKAYSDHLTLEGYDISVAYDGQEGLEKVKEVSPDLILLDILMPVMDGITALKKLKEDPKTKDIPVMILTNSSSQERIVEATELGSIIYFVKANASLEKLSQWIKDILK
ncbi:PleD family two-component system response regulator [Patescibacteria group bacterium]